MRFASLAQLATACRELPAADAAAEAAVAAREAMLTKPAGSLGRLEEAVAWLARWQGRNPPRLERVEVLVFAGNHGVTARGVSAYPAAVTAQMVANFAAGGAAINQLARIADAHLRVLPLSLDRPTADFTAAPALTEQDFLVAIETGFDAVGPQADLVCLGESRERMIAVTTLTVDVSTGNEVRVVLLGLNIIGRLNAGKCCLSVTRIAHR